MHTLRLHRLSQGRDAENIVHRSNDSELVSSSEVIAFPPPAPLLLHAFELEFPYKQEMLHLRSRLRTHMTGLDVAFGRIDQ